MEEYLKCNICGEEYRGKMSIELAKKMEVKYDEICRRDGIIRKGISPCPDMKCKGELQLLTD